MVKIIRAGLLLTALQAWLPLASANHEPSRSCECASSHLYNAYASADQIVFGKIISAKITESEDQIAFTVEVYKTHRGAEQQSLELTTSLPEACGYSVRAGTASVFALGVGRTHVSYCDFVHEGKPLQRHLFPLVLELTESFRQQGRFNTELLRDYLRPGMPRGPIDYILKMAQSLDPVENYQSTDRSVRYRNLEVYLSNDKVVDYVCP